MSDDLVKRLREAAVSTRTTERLICDEAADELVRLNAENARLREALEGVIRIADRDCPEFRAARAALKQSEPKP